MQSMQINLSKSLRCIGSITQVISQFPLFSNVRPIDGSALTLEVPLLDWPLDRAMFLLHLLVKPTDWNVHWLRKPDHLSVQWDWSDITKAFSPQYCIGNLPTLLHAGLLPDDPKSLYLALFEQLRCAPQTPLELPFNIAST